MNTPYVPQKATLSCPAAILTSLLAVLILFLGTHHSYADDRPDRSYVQLSGMYKVASSSDTLFPISDGTEWFLDFGSGLNNGASSGKVAVSLRQNPNVSVRVMVWQYLPNERSLLIGNQYSEGSRQAVARAVWAVSTESDGVVLARGNTYIVLHRADPTDY